MSRHRKSEWDGYRQSRRFGWLFFPLWGLIILRPEYLPYLILPLVVSVIFMIRVQWLPCPQCGQPFFCGGSFIFNRYKPWAESCAHCGHPKWAEPIPKPPRPEPYPWPQPNARPDPEDKRRSELTTFLELVLASDPSSICLKLDPEGWVDLDHLIARSKFNGLIWTRDQVVELLEQSSGPGFELDPTETRIRCIRH